ncbi:hypothetical protein ACET3Z_032842 [Daucus carota]
MPVNELEVIPVDDVGPVAELGIMPVADAVLEELPSLLPVHDTVDVSALNELSLMPVSDLFVEMDLSSPIVGMKRARPEGDA